MYQYKTEPYQHQREVFDASWRRKYFALFMEMGTGKSKVALDTMAALYEAGEINTVLIAAPKGVFDNWIKAEIPTHLPDRIKTKIVRWQPNITKKYQAEIEAIALPEKREPGFLHILVMNIEAFSTSKGAGAGQKFLKLNPENMLILEAGEQAKYKRILTGSPITKSPMDLFSQCYFLDPTALNFRSYYSFQNRYAIVVRRAMGHRSFQEITGYRRLDELGEKLDTFSSRVLKEDCLDLPDKIYTQRQIPLTAEQMRLYGQMQELALAQLAKGKLATTQSVLTQIMRLQQICCGYLQPDDGRIQEIPHNRLNELLAVCDEFQGKAIVWATWTHDIHKIAEALRRRYGAHSTATYFGDTPQDERQEIVEQFQDPDSELRFFVGQPKTGGYGITLTAASTVIYYSNSYDLEIRLQSEDRAHRIGQNSAVTYVDLVAPNTIDEKILEALRGKINIAGEVLGENTKDWLI